MSCAKGVPVITMEKLCEPKLKCWVCDRAREVRGLAGRPEAGDGPATSDEAP